ncbi:anti-sigma factor antagonist [Saccharopolyspora rhizosphaerae]|uniref:Anti-sigma factor antagonist n=1 Tax=Saccharopolyspora rhizosphaerae TaxID=2492662 RepID=A0A426JMA4_9PSEU|nr:STAS domain-containing protein [Saccharopolyspora rhizosphaerae]RRO14180.1 anti-sigma factor antagonist [Saccharopolyspora rhizosphaerae]
MEPDNTEHQTPFSAETEWSGRTLLVTATGEVELVNAPKLASVLEQAIEDRPEVLVLDITGVTFLSSAGLAVLVRTHRNAEAASIRFGVVADNPATRRPIQLMGLDQEFELFADREGALAGAAGL